MKFKELTLEELQQLEEESTLMNSIDSVRYIVVHCAATRASQTYTEDDLLRDHLKRGFRKVGYHFYIRKDGTVSQHRHLMEVGAHCKPFNRCSIGVCYEGGLDDDGKPADTRTDAQKAAMRDLIGELKALYPQALVMGHRDMPGARACDCPSFDATYEFGALR